MFVEMASVPLIVADNATCVHIYELLGGFQSSPSAWFMTVSAVTISSLMHIQSLPDSRGPTTG